VFLKTASAAADLSSVSTNKNKVGFYFWKTVSMALSLKGITVGIEWALMKLVMASAETSPSKSFLFSSKVLYKTKSLP